MNHHNNEGCRDSPQSLEEVLPMCISYLASKQLILQPGQKISASITIQETKHLVGLVRYWTDVEEAVDSGK